MRELDATAFAILFLPAAIGILVWFAIEWARKRAAVFRQPAVAPDERDEVRRLMVSHVLFAPDWTSYAIAKLPGDYWFHIIDKEGDSVETAATIEGARLRLLTAYSQEVEH